MYAAHTAVYRTIDDGRLPPNRDATVRTDLLLVHVFSYSYRISSSPPFILAQYSSTAELSTAVKAIVAAIC
jgi:hypothetical protein